MVFIIFQVFDNMTLIGRYCGSTQPPVITSSSDLLEIHFEADGSTNGGGFTAYYSDSSKIHRRRKRGGGGARGPAPPPK